MTPQEIITLHSQTVEDYRQDRDLHLGLLLFLGAALLASIYILTVNLADAATVVRGEAMYGFAGR